MENELKFNSDAKYVENNYSSYMSWNIIYFITCKVTAVMIAIWSWKYKISPFGVFFFFFFLNYWLTLRGDRLVEKTMTMNQQFFCVEAIFHRCCKFISFLEIFGNLSLYSKLSAITSNIFRRNKSEREHSREHSTEYSDLETTECIKIGNETILWCANIRFSAKRVVLKQG